MALLPTDIKLYSNAYKKLTEEQQNELKKTIAGQFSQVGREGIELFRMISDPSQSETEKTEKFLEDLYSKVVGSENVTRVQRGDREVVEIKEPDNSALQIVRDIGAFTGSMMTLGKLKKPVGAVLPTIKTVEKIKKLRPKTVSRTGFLLRGEGAAQLSINPYEENLANFLGDMIDDDSQSLFGDLETYLLEPIKSSQEKSELQNRIGLLSTGLALTGAFGAGIYTVGKRKEISKHLINTLDNIKARSPEAAQAFLNKVRRIRTQDKDFYDTVKAKREKAVQQGKALDMGDIEAIKPNFVSGRNFGGRFSTIPFVRQISNFLAKTFTSRGGRSEALHEKYLKSKFAKEGWEKTIDHVARNLETELDKITKELSGSNLDLIDEVNDLLFRKFDISKPITDKTLPFQPRGTILKGDVPKTQEEAFEQGLLKFPESIREPLKKARNLQDSLSKLLLKSEIVSDSDKKIISEQLGFYVRNSFRLFEDGNYVPTISAYNNARRFIKRTIRDQYTNKKTGKLNITNADLKLKTQAAMEELAGGKGEFTKFSSGFDTFNKLKSGILTERVDVPPAIREFLGEVTSPTEKLLISMKKIAQFVEDSKFYKSAYEDGKGIYFFDNKPGSRGSGAAPPGYTAQIPSAGKKGKVQPFGDLSGKWTTPELAAYFTKVNSYTTFVDNLPPVLREFWRLNLFLKGQSQKSATVRRITTHLKNIFGGGQITGANGFRLLNGNSIAKSFQLIKAQLTKSSDVEKQKLLEEIAGQGVLNKNAVINDLNNLAASVASSPLVKNRFSQTPLQYLKSLPVLRSLIKGDEKLTEAYIAEDDFWKQNMYFQEKEFLETFNNALPKQKILAGGKGKISDKFDKYRFNTAEEIQNEAGRLTRNGLPNYDLVPENLQMLRVIPYIGTFFSFLSESVRLAYTIPRQSFREYSLYRQLKADGADKASKLMRDRALDRAAGFTVFGLAGGAGVSYGASQIANYAYGVTQDTIDNLKPFLPDWMQNDNLVYTLNEDGEPIVYNITPWDAFDFPRKPFQTAFNIAVNRDLTEDEQKQFQYDLLEETFTPFFGESLTQEIVNSYTFRNGKNPNGSVLKNPFNPVDTYTDYGNSFENFTKNLDILMYNFAERLVPGTITDFEKFRKTWGKEKTEYDQDIYPSQALAKFITGFSGMPMNKEYVENIYSFKVNEFVRRKSEKRRTISSSITDDITPEKFINNWNKVNREYYNDFRKIHFLTEAGENLGLDTKTILQDSNVSVTDMATFLGSKRYFMPIELTEPMITDIKNARLLKESSVDIQLKINDQVKAMASLPVLVETKEEREEISNKNISKEFKDIRVTKVEGGLIEGEDVPFTREDPADRINPFTNEPYSGKTLDDLFLDEESERLGFQKGTPEKIYSEDYDFNLDEGLITYKYADGSQIEMYNEPPVKQVVPVIELLVGGVPKVVAGLGKAGFDLVENLTRQSTKVAKPMNYYHGSPKQLRELIPAADRVRNKDVKDLYQAGTYLGKPNEKGFKIAAMYAKDKGFVNVVDEKQFNQVAGKLFNPRNIPEDIMQKFSGAVANRQQAIKLATTQREKAKIRKEIIDLENLFKPSTSGYISRINTRQRDFLKDLGYDGVDVSDDVVVAFNKLNVKKAVDNKLIDKLRKRQEKREGFKKGGPSTIEEYEKRIKEMEELADMRAVNKEAQMNMLMGEGYTDPRFIKSTGNPLIDKYGMRPFPAEGSGLTPTTKQLGMEGDSRIQNPSTLGTYNRKKDIVTFKDLDGALGDKVKTQIHEFVHRAANKTGYFDNYFNSEYLEKEAPYFTGSRGYQLQNLVNEALAHSYEYTDLKDEGLKKDIKFRTSKFNIREDFKDIVSEQLFNNISKIRKDFETHLENFDKDKTN